ncbi:MAG: tRNA (adenosine(37)-N6)-threonylcarbamoyltransferase complex transferase subunit TsaD, partial [Spirochaetota bacterium]
MLVMGIESSCDECAIAIVEDGRRILSNEVASQIDIHRPFDGVVPEIASRMHTEWIFSVAEKALESAGVSLDQIDG